MKTNKINKNITMLFFLLSLTNCKKESNESVIIEDNNQGVVFKFPDSILKNEVVVGHINYSLDLDTIEQKEISSRYIFLHFTTELNKDLNLAEIKDMNHMTVEDTTKKGKFIFKTKISSIGNKTFNGAIEDIIILKDSSQEGKVRILTKETNTSKNFFVKSGKVLSQMHL